MLKKMGEAVARVARKVNETVESGSDTLDLAECKLVSFPIGIYKVLRNVSDQIHLITLANNELKSLTSKFMTTFSQLRELHLEGNFLHRLPNEVSTLQHLKAIDLSRNKFRDFPEQLTTLPVLETISLEENEIVGKPSQPPNGSWVANPNGSTTETGLPANLTFSSYYQHSSPVAAMFIVAYVLIFLLCMVGNALVCFTVLRNRHMRTVTNMFILNLAVSDLLVGIFCMPTTLVDNLITGWPFDNATCKMSGLVQGMSVSASVFTLVAIAVERFRCIVHPFREKLTLRKALVTIAVIWALALLIMCPSAVTLTVTREEHHFMVDARNRSYPLYSCWEAWPEKGMRKVYTAVLFSHIYLAPLALIVVMYARIARKLCQAAGPARPGGEAVAEGGRAARRRARVVHMLVMVALFFTLSWLPLWALLLLIDYGQLSEPQLHLVSVYAFPFAHWLAFFNSSANPIIYGYFNENFRRGFQAAFRARLCPPQWGGPKEAYSERPGGLLRKRVFMEVQPSDSGLPSESGASSGAVRPGRLPLRHGRVAHQDLPGEGPGCSHLPLTIPAWDT